MSRLNMLGILVGPSEYGKSTIIREHTLAHLSGHPRARAFVHDPHGEDDDINRVYPDADAARAALERNAPGLSRGFSIGGSSSAVRDLAMYVGKRHNKKDAVALPVFAAFHESSLMDSSSKTNMGADDIDVCSNRRHYGVALMLNVQAVKNLTEGWFQNATDVWILSQSNDEDARELERRLGLDKGVIRASPIWRAPPFRVLRWQRGLGLVAGRLSPNINVRKESATW